MEHRRDRTHARNLSAARHARAGPPTVHRRVPGRGFSTGRRERARRRRRPRGASSVHDRPPHDHPHRPHPRGRPRRRARRPRLRAHRVGRDAHLRRRAALPRPGRPARTARPRSPRWSSRCVEPGRAAPASQRVLFVVYTERRPRSPTARSRRLVRGLRARPGSRWSTCCAPTVERWFPLLRSRRRCPRAACPTTSPRTRSRPRPSSTGRVTHASRDELAGRSTPDDDLVARVAAACATALSERAAGRAGMGAVRTVAPARPGPAASPDDDGGRPGCCVPSGPTRDARDAAWCELRRHDAQHHVELWTDAVRRAPDDLAGSGRRGARRSPPGWPATARSPGAPSTAPRTADPDYSLAALVADLLAAAVPPSAWEEVHGLRDPA